MNKPSGRLLVREIVVTYTLEGDPEQKEHTFGLKHADEKGAAIDGFAWSRELMDKLAYMEQGDKCRRAQQKPGGKEWKRTRGKPGGTSAGTTTEAGVMEAASLSSTSAGAGGEPECIFIHTTICEWLVYCDPDW